MNIEKNNIEILYFLFFNLMSIPIFDMYHVMIGFIPTLGYLVNKININKRLVRLECTVLFCVMLCYFGYMLLSPKNDFYSKSNVLNYRLFRKDMVDSLIIINDYLKDNYNNNIYIIDLRSYLFKLYGGYRINKYDLLNNGNLVYNGAKKIIEELDNNCRNNKCTFLMNSNIINNNDSQYNQDIINYVYNTYNITGSILGYYVYKN